MSRLRKAAIIVGTLIILAGLLGLAYPAVGSFINSMTHRRAVMDYQKEAKALPDADILRMLREAKTYNQWICSRGDSITGLNEEEMEEYNGLLAVSATGIMGYIEIPKIRVTLPIYHGTREEVLQVGVGHLAGSSLPVGGPGTHAVLTGHSGLPSSRLFTDLDQLTYGDAFTVTVLNRSSTYEVDRIEVVEPDEAEHQDLIKDEDYCTLVTCTPIGINSHRLIVRGRRAPELETEAVTEAAQSESEASDDWENTEYRTQIIIACAAIAVILAAAVSLIAALCVKRRNRRRQGPKGDRYEE